MDMKKSNSHKDHWLPGTKSPLSLNQSMLKKLKCPVCFDTMRPPIMLCHTGHSICEDCRQQLLTCPTCKAGFGGRNYTLESMCEDLHYLCINKKCGVEFKLPDLADHALTCHYRKFECYLCGWDGIQDELLNHFEDHDNVTINEEGKLCFDVARTEHTHYLYAYDILFVIKFIRKNDLKCLGYVYEININVEEQYINKDSIITYFFRLNIRNELNDCRTYSIMDTFCLSAARSHSFPLVLPYNSVTNISNFTKGDIEIKCKPIV